jgi:UDP-N-acetyl-2-amino-2-deoxyglucuronate dehydrogenase
MQRGIEVEDTLVATMRFANDAMATVTATTTAAPGLPHRFKVYGTCGGVQIDGEAVVRCRMFDERAKIPADLAAQLSAPPATSADRHAALARDFVLALREDRAPGVDGAEGRRSLAAVLAIYQSAGLI